MPRGLLATIAFAGFLLWWPCVAENQRGTPHTGHHQPAQHATDIPPAGAVINPPVAAPCSEKEPCYTKDAAAEKLPPHWRRPEWVIVYVTIIYVLITGLTLRAIKRQADLMEAQIVENRKISSDATDVARRAAEAALLNAQAVINSERAWLLFTVAKDEKQDFFVVKVVNYGRVPARDIEIGNPIHALMSVSDLIASAPDYGEDVADIQEYLAPKEEWIVATIFPQRTTMEKFYNKTYPAPPTDSITYGQITYLDGISNEVRHSRYCIALDVDDRYEPISVVGSKEYLDCN